MMVGVLFTVANTCMCLIVEGFFDVPGTKEDSNNSKIPEKLNPKAHDAFLLFQVFICLFLYSNHFMHTGYSSVDQRRPINMATCQP